MIVLTDEQRTADWFRARAGRLTGSAAKDMLSVVKTGEAAGRRDLRLRLAVERLTGEPQEDGYVSKDMQRGIDKEADAVAAYEALVGVLSNSVGFVSHDELMAGCSVDGEIDGYKGILECKCPRSATHLSYIRNGTIPKDYMAQITHNLWITGAEWCDFVSFDDRMPTGLQLFYRRVPRASVDFAAYELIVRQFLAEVDKEVEALMTIAKQVAA